MQQIVDLQNDVDFQATGVQVLSIARDSLDEMASEQVSLGITDVPLLSDPENIVAEQYNVLQWALENGEPGHTFILVDEDGKVVWIKDYGAPNNPDRTMYVPIAELIQAAETALK